MFEDRQKAAYSAAAQLSSAALLGKTIAVPGDRPQTAVESLTEQNQSNNSNLLELETRIRNILDRIGHHSDTEKACGPSAPPQTGSLNLLAGTIQHGASIGTRLHQLLSALETYI